MEEGLFAYWKRIDPKLAEMGSEIEEKVFVDPHSVLVKARVFAEKLTMLVNEKENIQEVYEVKQVDRLRKLFREEIMVQDVFDRFDWLRKMGNKAAHEPDTVKVEASIQAHRYLYDISIWYMEVYGDLDFQAPTYELPQVKTNPTINTAEIEQVIESSLGKMLGAKFDNMMELVKQQLAANIQQTEQQPEVQQKISLTDYLTQSGLVVIDNRDKKGAYWVIGGWELNEILFPLKDCKIYFRFSQKGGKATNNQPAWFLLNKTKDELFVQR